MIVPDQLCKILDSKNGAFLNQLKVYSECDDFVSKINALVTNFNPSQNTSQIEKFFANFIIVTLLHESFTFGRCADIR